MTGFSTDFNNFQFFVAIRTLTDHRFVFSHIAIMFMSRHCNQILKAVIAFHAVNMMDNIVRRKFTMSLLPYKSMFWHVTICCFYHNIAINRFHKNMRYLYGYYISAHRVFKSYNHLIVNYFLFNNKRFCRGWFRLQTYLIWRPIRQTALPPSDTNWACFFKSHISPRSSLYQKVTWSASGLLVKLVGPMHRPVEKVD